MLLQLYFHMIIYSYFGFKYFLQIIFFSFILFFNIISKLFLCHLYL